jgi:outer membrane immunogenic protein
MPGRATEAKIRGDDGQETGMKRIALAAAISLSATAALAADLPAPPPPQAPAAYVPVAAPVYNWGGIYVGINGGYGFGSSAWSPAGTTGTGNFDINGGLVGGTVGANFQTGQFVFGIEGDIDWSDINGSTTIAGCNGGLGCTFQTQNDWLGTVRGRVGYAFDRLLIYGTAGGAFGDIKANFTTPGFAASATNTQFGWTAGGGVEYGITENITARVEYLFVDLSNSSVSCTAPGCPVASVPVSFDASLVRAGVNFKFGGF